MCVLTRKTLSSQEKNEDTLGLYGDNGKENGNCCSITGYIREPRGLSLGDEITIVVPHAEGSRGILRSSSHYHPKWCYRGYSSDE